MKKLIIAVAITTSLLISFSAKSDNLTTNIAGKTWNTILITSNNVSAAGNYTNNRKNTAAVKKEKHISGNKPHKKHNLFSVKF